MPGEAPGQDRKAGVQAMQQPADPVYIREYNKAPIAEVPVASNQALFGYQNAGLPAEKVTVAQASPMAAPIPQGNIGVSTAPIGVSSAPVGVASAPVASVTTTHTVPVVRWYTLPFTRTFYTQRVIPRVRRVYTFARGPRLFNWAKANKALAITLGISLLLLPLLASMLAGRGPLGLFSGLPFFRSFGSSATKVEVHVQAAPEHRSFMDWFLRRDNYVEETHHSHHAHHDKSGIASTIAKGAALAKGAGIMKDAASNIIDKAKDTIDLAKDTTGNMASKMWEAAKDTAGAAATVGASAGVWEKTKDAAERVVDRIMHPGGHEHVETHGHHGHVSSGHTKPVDVHVHVDTAHGSHHASTSHHGSAALPSAGFLARTLGRFALFRTLLRLTPLGILTLLGLFTIPLALFFMRRRAPLIQQRPQVVPVVRPVGYAVVGGAGQQNIPAGTVRM